MAKNKKTKAKKTLKPIPQSIIDKTAKKIVEEKKSWFSPEAIIMLTAIFLITQTIGLLAAHQFFVLGAQQPIITQDVNDIENGLYLFGVIIAMTIIMVMILRLKRGNKFLWVIEALAIFSTSLLVFSAFLPTSDLLAILLTAFILYMRYWKRNNIFIRNIAAMIAIIGAGAYIGISLGVMPVLVFITILAVYDIIAVFYTKHMIEIGKAATEKNFAFTVAIPTKKHHFELGNGDLVIPLIAATSILTNGPFQNNALIAGACIIASYIGLLFSIYSVSELKRPMPALPPQTLLMAIVLITGFILGL